MIRHVMSVLPQFGLSDNIGGGGEISSKARADLPTAYDIGCSIRPVCNLTVLELFR
jgi:hypothetical protein